MKSMKRSGQNEVVPEGGGLLNQCRTTFDSVKKKLTFDEDFITPIMLPYEAGMTRKSSNPFVMNDAGESSGLSNCNCITTIK